MPNDALAAVLKSSSWFEDHIRRIYGEDSDYAAFIDYISGRSRDSTPSQDDKNVSAFGTNAPRAPSFDSLGQAAAGYFSNPANIGDLVASAIPGLPALAGSMIGAPIGGFLGQQFGEPTMVGISDINPETGVPMGRPAPVDPRSIGMLRALGAQLLSTIFDSIPADLFSPAELQTPHPDIGTPLGAGYRSPGTEGPADTGQGGFGTPGQFSGNPPGVNAAGELSVGEHPSPSSPPSNTSNEGTSNSSSGTGPGTDIGIGMENAAMGGGGVGATGPAGDPSTGEARGGLVRRQNLFGPNPPGPDEGAAYLQTGEMVMPRVAVEHFGKKRFFNMIKEAHEARGEHERMMKDVTPSRGASMRGRRMFG